MTAPRRLGVRSRICCRLGIPGEQFVDAVDLVIGDTLEDLGEPGLRVDAIEPDGLDQGLPGAPSLADPVRALFARRKNRLLARQMTGKRVALRLPLGAGGRLGNRLRRLRDLLVLDPELKLVEGLQTWRRNAAGADPRAGA